MLPSQYNALRPQEKLILKAFIKKEIEMDKNKNKIDF